MKETRKVRIIWSVIVVLATGAAGFAVAPYLYFDPSLSRVELNPSFPPHYALLLVHIWCSFLALLIGWIQFLPVTRKRRMDVHRMVGQIYLGLVAVGGVTGLTVGMFATSYIRQMAFLTLGLLWLFTAWKGYRKVRLGEYGEHRMWMVRNYSLTLVAASARLLTPFCILIYLAGHGGQSAGGVATVMKQVLQINIWIGLATNLVIAEWIILSRIKR
ncbi:DUF2306 domain-containing protein [Brevibacillus choshinensis]|uniref:DUF2306 domain-containing protein n=1 Tax=Brevibacillus choshinensis TaxID=54911 RepID=UPI002E1D0B94|nr:DUF2306 domain-containing protein [Brevibacillus choshinensis]MED4780478.1 DUF2306 domain-containing protein [Brevibacillus choshinensis]